MFGFLFGTACLLGLTATFARSRHEGHHCGGQRGRGFRSGRGRFVLNRLLDRLDTTPGQEKVIREAVDTVMEDVHDARGEFRATRVDVAQAIRSETLDRGAIDGVFERHDQVIERVRQSALDSFSKVHETLDERQRKILAELIEAGPFARGFGPFR
ncbi:MAG: periplasmic heavy metal sensor [Pseudomonadota bacterium]